ncbi:MAG: phosphatidylglycerol lysyltransferase domain-containing protein [Eubacterium sp.]|nr:phosphatidylglycerol lysyltransferase domain-containing protein [Eubacterium sp.]
MRKDSKIYIPPEDNLIDNILKLGYRKLKLEDEKLFDSYFSQLDGYYSSSLCFVNMYSWEDTFPTFYTEYEGFIVGMNYDYIDSTVYIFPFFGKYNEEGVIKAFNKVCEDMKSLGRPVIIFDVSDWMLPYYEATGAEMDVIYHRSEMDYVFTREMFFEGLNKQDDRYRYNYFKRKFNYETVEVTPEMSSEVLELMEDVWCNRVESCEECAYGCLKHITNKQICVSDKLDVHGILVRVDGIAEGVSLVTNKNGMGVYQYKNANNSLKGINEYLLRECFERYMDGAEYINYTEDLGLATLRRYKMHMAPEYILKPKYLLKVKANE